MRPHSTIAILTWGPPWGGGTNWGDMRGLASGLLRYDKPPKLASTLRGGGHFPKCTFFGHFLTGDCAPNFFLRKRHRFLTGDWLSETRWKNDQPQRFDRGFVFKKMFSKFWTKRIDRRFGHKKTL